MNSSLTSHTSGKMDSEELFKKFDEAFYSFHKAVDLIQWDRFTSQLQDIHYVPLTLVSAITECSICLGNMQHLQPSIPLYSVLRTLMESSYKFRYLIADPSKLQLHALQLQYSSVDQEEVEGEHWRKTPHSDPDHANHKSQELLARKIELKKKFELIGSKPSSKDFAGIIEFLHDKDSEDTSAIKGNWAELTGISHARLDALQRYTYRQYAPDAESASKVRNNKDQYLIYSAAIEYLHHAAVAATALFNRMDWYQKTAFKD